MSKYNDELPATFVERHLAIFLKQNQDILNTTVGETILIIQATTNYIDDLLQGVTTKEQRALVVDATMEHTKRLMLAKVGKYEESKNSEKDAESNSGTRQVRKKAGQNKAVQNVKSVRASRASV